MTATIPVWSINFGKPQPLNICDHPRVRYNEVTGLNECEVCHESVSILGLLGLPDDGR